MLRGIYVLVIKLPKSRAITIGKLGTLPFSYGYYAYVGSAFNGVEARITRHLRKEKTVLAH